MRGRFHALRACGIVLCLALGACLSAPALIAAPLSETDALRFEDFAWEFEMAVYVMQRNHSAELRDLFDQIADLERELAPAAFEVLDYEQTLSKIELSKLKQRFFQSAYRQDETFRLFVETYGTAFAELSLIPQGADALESYRRGEARDAVNVLLSLARGYQAQSAALVGLQKTGMSLRAANVYRVAARFMLETRDQRLFPTQQIVTVLENVVVLDPAAFNDWMYLSWFYQQLARWEDSQVAAERAAENASNPRQQSIALEQRADILESRALLDEAEALLQESFSIRMALAAFSSVSPYDTRGAVIVSNRLGDLALRRSDTASAKVHYTRALDILEGQLAGTADPDNLYRSDLALSHRNLGELYGRDGDVASAMTHFEEGLSISQELVALDSGNTAYRRDLYLVQLKLAQFLVGQRLDGKFVQESFDRARDNLALALESSSEIFASDGANHAIGKDVLLILGTLVDLHGTLGQGHEASQYLDRAFPTLSAMLQFDGGNEELRRAMFLLYVYQGRYAAKPSTRADALLALQWLESEGKATQADRANFEQVFGPISN